MKFTHILEWLNGTTLLLWASPRNHGGLQLLRDNLRRGHREIGSDRLKQYSGCAILLA